MNQTLLQVTGLSRSTADIRLPSLVYGVPVLCPIASADVLDISSEQLVGQRGVLGILTADSALSGLGRRLQPLLSQLLSKTVSCAGQIVALVLADSPQLASSVACQISLRIREQPGPLTVHAAIAKGSSRQPIRLSSGQPAEAFADSRTRLRQTYRTLARLRGDFAQGTATAVWRGDALTVYAIGASQSALRDRLGLPEDKLLLVSSELGESQALNLSSSLLAAIAAAHLDRPVSVTLPALSVAGTVPETMQTLSLGLDAEDLPHALLLHGAVAGSFSGQPSELSAMDLAAAYGFAHRELSLLPVAVHLPTSDRFVGVELEFSLEAAIDELATQRGEDPIQLRLRWLANRPDGDRLHRCLLALQRLCGSSASASSSSTSVMFGQRRGLGIAAAAWRSSSGPLLFGAHAIEVSVSSGRIDLVRHLCVLDVGAVDADADSVVRKSLAHARKLTLRKELSLQARTGWISSSLGDSAHAASVASLEIQLLSSSKPGLSVTHREDVAAVAASGVSAALVNALSSALGVRLRTVSPSVVAAMSGSSPW
ncbi:MAG: xanthine dehydrogenase family protein molybdopterin-binding subunit [Myxococcales bacterium]|nr:xanthine dehydrogenase family protein molybdopterin-binding subunit [Myxococcales bacterium]